MLKKEKSIFDKKRSVQKLYTKINKVSYVASGLSPEHYHPERVVDVRTTIPVVEVEHSCTHRIAKTSATIEPRVTRTDEVGVIGIPSTRLT